MSHHMGKEESAGAMPGQNGVPLYTHTRTRTLTKALQTAQEEISRAERTLLTAIQNRMTFGFCKPRRRSNKIELTFEVSPLHCRLKHAHYFESDYCACVKSCCFIEAAIQARLPQDSRELSCVAKFKPNRHEWSCRLCWTCKVSNKSESLFGKYLVDRM